MRLLHELEDAIHRLGFVNAALFVASRVLSAASHGRCRLYRYHFFAQPIPRKPIVRAERSSRLLIRRVHRGDPLITQFPRPLPVIEHRFEIGARCIAAEKDGVFAGYIWLKTQEYPEDEVRCRYVLGPPGDAIWDFDVYVSPAYRVGRTFVRLWEFVNMMLRANGYYWSLSRISGFNPESLAAHARLAVRRIGTATFVRLGALQISLFDRRPWIHIGWRESHVPSLRLRGPAREAQIAAE